MRIRTPLAVTVIMAVAMQTDDFPYLPSGAAEVNKMIMEHGDLFSDSQCKVCSAVLISTSQKLTHYQSKKHANKVRRYFLIQNEKQPALKKLKTSPPDSNISPLDSDLQTKDFRLKPAGPPAPAQQQKKKPADDPSGDNNNNPDRFCSICQASFNNPLMAQQHYVGKKHRKQTTKLKLLETYGPSKAAASTLKGYPCTVCNIELNSVEQYQSHISGAKHKNQVKKSGLSPTETPEAAEPPQGGADQYAATDFQYAAADDQYTGGNNQYAPEDTEYTEEYQFT